MKLTDMKLKPRKEGDAKVESTIVGDEPKYPWGLQVRLENEQLEKLGVDKLPAVGTTVVLTARCEVCETGEYQAQKGEQERRNVTLQITELGLSGESKVSGDDIYGADKKK
ncbi:MAG: BcepC6B [Gemmatimonadales bacterium]|jgi:hypothetical protein|nr:BcepC6B [Gemmatimonadales bacterium]